MGENDLPLRSEYWAYDAAGAAARFRSKLRTLRVGYCSLCLVLCCGGIAAFINDDLVAYAVFLLLVAGAAVLFNRCAQKLLAQLQNILHVDCDPAKYDEALSILSRTYRRHARSQQTLAVERAFCAYYLDDPARALDILARLKIKGKRNLLHLRAMNLEAVAHNALGNDAARDKAVEGVRAFRLRFREGSSMRGAIDDFLEMFARECRPYEDWDAEDAARMRERMVSNAALHLTSAGAQISLANYEASHGNVAEARSLLADPLLEPLPPIFAHRRERLLDELNRRRDMAVDVEMIVQSERVFTSQKGECETRPLAFAISEGRIVRMGEPEDVIAACPAGTPVHDFGDAFVCPGFHDAHLHFFHTALGSSPFLLMHMGESEAELVERTVEFACTLPEHAWVVTQGWRDYRWNPPVPPTKHSLDAAFPDRPCVMYSGDGHTLWVNSCALEALGITRDSVPPQGGSYDVDENGELTGVIQEAAAMELLPRCLEWLTEEDIARAYEDQMGRMAEQGITSICDMALMPHEGCDFIRDDIYEALAAEGRLALRAHLFPTLLDDQSRLEDLQRRFGESEWLQAPGFKQFFDGVSSQHTAWLTDPYTNAYFEGDVGRPTIPADRMRELVLAAAERGRAVRIHAIGDAAIHEALDIFEEARTRFGAPKQGRNTLEHLENLLPGDIDRLRELDVLASSQPGHITLDPGGPERDLGLERSQVMWPFATYLERGVAQAFGTDSPITAVTSMDVLYAAVTRQDPFTHKPEGGWLPEERISAADALRIYTAGSAEAVGREDELGQLAPGYLADFVVLSRDITACDPEEIQDTQVLATYVGGQCVFER